MSREEETQNEILQYQIVLTRQLIELERLLLPPEARIYSEKDIAYIERLIE